ncbi:hypothetical protein AKJ16_DCAP04476 [Drosera capensis]
MAAAASLSVSDCRRIPLSPAAASPLRAKGKAAFKENFQGHRNRRNCTIYALLEKSGSSSEETGWLLRHIIGKDELDNIIGVVPLYLKRYVGLC